jgi:hypothetical protein
MRAGETASDKNADPIALYDRAMDNLCFIRETMERAVASTAVSGIGLVAAGIVACIAAPIAAAQSARRAWLGVWLIAAAVAASVAAATMWRKARRLRTSLLSKPGRKLLLNLSPPIFAGALLTCELARRGDFDVLPAMWMLLYGAGVITGGAFSVRLVPTMGACFMVAGAFGLLFPAWQNVLLAISFGGLHLVFGALISKNHGG